MAQRILTNLCRILAGKPTTEILPGELSPEMFPDLLKTTTLRLVTPLDFCRFGREQLGESMGITGPDDEANYVEVEQMPPSCVSFIKQPFWFELIDASFTADAARPGAAIFCNPGQGVARVLGYDAQSRLRSLPLDDPHLGDHTFSMRYDPDYVPPSSAVSKMTPEELKKAKRVLYNVAGPNSFEWFAEEIVGALFVLNEMPPECIDRSDTPLKVPPYLRNSVPKKSALFSTVYLRREFTDVVATAKAQQTLDISGRRFHFVRGHWMRPKGKTDRVWRKFHWRGDAELGVVRKVYRAI